MEVCPQCSVNANESSNRIVQDSCGHKKCRKCLLNDEESCKMCVSSKLPSVIRFESDEGNKDKVEVVPIKGNIIKEKKTELKKGDGTKRPYHRVELPSHIVMITENDYKCNVCLKEFTTKAHIKYHKFCAGGKLAVYFRLTRGFKRLLYLRQKTFCL